MPQNASVDQLAAPGVVPMLPCADIDEIEDFYTMLGFERTYRQTRPNPYVALQRSGLQLHFFGMDGFDPADSYGTCGVFVPDTGALYQDFAARMRARHGKVLIAGLPRMTRPRKRWNIGGYSGFSVIDPGGNWIRIFRVAADQAVPDPTGEPGESKLAKVYRNAVVIADSHGDEPQAAKIIDSRLRSVPADQDHQEPTADLAQLLLYRAELAVRLDDPATAQGLLARFRTLELREVDPERVQGFADQAATLAEQVK
jgi:catechol 2,3-dioxygenase-like lactoylglutathione lyase family enzyme